MSICVVTGGRGFLGRHLVCKLLESGRWVVRILDLAPHISLSESEKELSAALESGQAQYVAADLRDLLQMSKALEGAEVVFHVGAADSSINDHKLHYAVNVVGTSNVIEACIQQGVKKLVYTSSPSVVFDYINGLKNADEGLPYPAKHMDTYSETKAQGEALVLEANGRDGLTTCAIRPSGIFGPGDRLFLPSIVAAAKAGKLKFQIGDGENKFDWTYVENVVHGHICAEKALSENPTAASGKAYFITNCDPVKFWDFISEFLQQLGYAKPKYKLPVQLVLPLSFIAEWMCKKLAPFGVPMTQFTPARIRYMSLWRTFNCKRAKHYLKYEPLYTMKEGIRRTVKSFQHLKAVETEKKNQGELVWSFVWTFIIVLLVYRILCILKFV